MHISQMPSGAPSGDATAPAADTRVALAVVTTVFFMWGFLTCLNDILIPHLDHVVQVSDTEVAAAMRALFTDTHNVAEGAGAAALAAALQEQGSLRGQCVGLALTGGNVDAPVFSEVLSQ